MAVSSPWTRWQDWCNALAGGWLVIAPFALGSKADAAATWTAVTVGVLVGRVALWALGQPRSQAAEWTNVTLGGLLFVAPWVLGYAAETAAAWNAWIVGAVVVALAGWALPGTRSGQQESTVRKEPIG